MVYLMTGERESSIFAAKSREKKREREKEREREREKETADLALLQTMF